MKKLSFKRKMMLSSILLGLFYYGVVVPPEYESSSQIVLKSVSKSNDSNLGSILLGNSFSNDKELFSLKHYLQSKELFNELNKSQDFKKLLISKRSVSGLYYGLRGDTGLYEAYINALNLSFESESSSLSLKIKTLDPKFSKDLLDEILKKSDLWVTDMNSELAQLSVEQYEAQQKRTFIELAKSQEELKALQGDLKVVDAEIDLEVRQQVISELLAEKSKLSLELAALKSTFSNESFEVKKLNASISNIESQINKLRGTGKDEEIDKAFKLRTLKSSVMLYEKELLTLSELKEQAIIQAQSKAFKIVKLSSPYQSESSTWLNVLKSLITYILLVITLIQIAFVFLKNSKIKDNNFNDKS